MEDYVNLFANFRAKVADAQAAGYDTVLSLERELARYRKELAAPYLIDSATLQNLLAEAYERNKYVVHAAHILVKCEPDASAADTLEALKRALQLRGRALKGEDFNKLAAEEVNRGAKKGQRVQPRDDEGDLGYFTVFNMVYPFENAAYTLKPGELSMPVRTRFGYHIIKVYDKVPFYGRTTFAHIWLRAADSSARRPELGTIMQQLDEGTPFAIVARRSDERTSASNGGLVEHIEVNQMMPQYVYQLARLKEGEYSRPFFTPFGWHIVQLVKRDTLPPYDFMTPYYKQRMTRDEQRGGASRRKFAADSRAQYGIVDRTVTPREQAPKKGKAKKAKVEKPVMMASLDQLIEKIPDSVMRGKWQYREADFEDTCVLVVTPAQSYGVKDVARYIRKHQKSEKKMAKDYYIRERYNAFLDSVSIVYAESQLENAHPEFAALIDEYRRGLMIFNYCDDSIWSKALHDTVGFVAFFESESPKKRLDNPDDSMFFWNTRARLVEVNVADSACLAPQKAIKVANKALNKDFSSSQILERMQSAQSKKHAKEGQISVEVHLVEAGHQTILTDNQWSKGVYATPSAKGYKVVIVQDVIEPTLKSRQEARGYYLNEYQNDIERRLNQRLRDKYNVKINWDVVNEITY